MSVQSFFQPKRFLWWLLGAFVAILAATFAWNSANDYRATSEREENRLLGQAKVLDSNLQRQIQGTSSALQSVRKDMEFLLYQPDGLQLMNRRMQALADAMPGVRTMLLINRRGYALASNREDLVGRDFSQREYFLTAQAGNDVTALYVSKPFKTVLGVFALNLSVVVKDQQGRFAGIVTATLDPEFFNTLMESVRYSEDVSTALVHGDGQLISRIPPQPELLGAQVTQADSLLGRHLSSRQKQTVAWGELSPAGTYALSAHSTLQPPDLRMDRPLLISITRNRADVFSAWQREAALRLSALAVITAVLAASVISYQRQQNMARKLARAREVERTQAERSLRESEHFAREIADNIPGLLAYWKSDLSCGYANKNYLTWFGRTQDEMKDISIRTMMGETLFSQNEPFIQAALRGEPQKFERTIVKPDGISGHTWTQYLPFIVDGQSMGFFALATDITEFKSSQDQLRLSDLALKASTQSVAISNEKRELIFVNDSFAKITGYPREEILGTNCRFLQGKNTDPRTVQAIRDALSSGGTFSGEILNYRKDGTPFWNDLNITTIRDESGQITNYVAVTRDSSTLRKINEALRISAAAFESQEGIFVTDTRSTILRVNKAFTDMTGYTEAEAVGQTPKLISSGRHDKAFYDAMWESINTTGGWQGEIWNRRKNGEVFPESITITTVRNEDGEPTHFVANFVDISARKNAEDEIKTLAFYDPLTKLPNRRMLLDRLQQLLAASHRNQHHGALLFVDLDNFKTLNDTRGHHQGDLLLEQVAQRLRRCVREGDTVARLGGDEFVVMLDDLSSVALEAANQAEKVGEKMLELLNEEYVLTGFNHRCSPSIGITLFGAEAETVDEPLKRADMAMYQAKAAGRNTLRFFDMQIQTALTQRAELEARLATAMTKQQFELHYQPQVNESRAIVGAEALVRWNDPERGMVSPAEFIPVAEECGLILPLGQWVLHTACAQIARWATQPDLSQLTIAVNVSAKQLQASNFVATVMDTLSSTGANPRRLKLEITESMLLKDVEGVIGKMSILKNLGIGFSLDDFGTGYSSLTYLKRLPLDHLKIDQGFVRDILVDANDAAISKTVIVLAQSLGLTVIAEGVETEAQRDFLAQQGCRVYQGYLFGKPLPLAAFEAYLAQPPSAASRSPAERQRAHGSEATALK